MSARSRLVACSAVLALALTASASRAQNYAIYTDKNAFLAAFPAGVDTFGWTGGSADGDHVDLPQYSGPMGFSTIARLTHGYMYNNDTYGPATSYLEMVGPGANSASQPISPAVVSAIAYDLGSPQGDTTLTIKLDYYNNLPDTYAIKGTPGTTTFIGIVSDQPLKQVSFFETNITELDIVHFYVPVAAVPEPASAGLAALAAPLLLVRRRRCA